MDNKLNSKQTTLTKIVTQILIFLTDNDLIKLC
jgi:hypothetical protein